MPHLLRGLRREEGCADLELTMMRSHVSSVVAWLQLVLMQQELLLEWYSH